MIEYTGTEDISTEGLQAGVFNSNPVYVGKAIVNGNYITITIHFSKTDGYCIYIKDKICTKSFYFMENVITYQYIWIPSQNGTGVFDAIDGINAIGRITKNSLTSIGSVDYQKGFVFINESTHNVDFAIDGYDVLTCVPSGTTTTKTTTVTETTTSYFTSTQPDYRCSKLWILSVGSLLCKSLELV